jgi:hypothetical protein
MGCPFPVRLPCAHTILPRQPQAPAEAGTPGGNYPRGELDTTLNPGPSPLTWVPFWKPPNITDSTISSTISSTIHSRQPAARDLGQRRRRPP